MRKFIQPVSMPCTQEQFEADLRNPLEEIGYEVGIHKHGEETPMVVNWMDQSLQTWVPGKEIEDVYSIPEYNPDLFKAVAAMSKGSEPFTGEWVWDGGTPHKVILCPYKSGMLLLDSGISSVSIVQKMTLTELISRFTQPTPKVEKEWEPVNGEECEFSDDQVRWQVASFIGKHKDDYVAYVEHSDSYQGYAFVRQIPPLTLTRSEAESRLTEIEGKTVLIKD